MTQKLTWAFGVVLTLVGIAGFVPGLTDRGILLGIFHVDSLHSIIHIVSGLAALAAAWGMYSSRLYFQVFGVVYAVVAVVGFVQGDTVLGIIGVNMADNLLHVVIAAIALYTGFMLKETPVMAPSSVGMGATM